MQSSVSFALQLIALIGTALLIAQPLGRYLADVLQGRLNAVARLGQPLERGFYRLAGVAAGEETDWRAYAAGLLLFNVAGGVVVYALLRLQAVLPFNPQHMGPLAPDLAFNTAVSFVTNTNWQAYAGEQSLGNLAQMAGLAVQNFLSAATGIVVAVALTRGLARHSAATIGNVWVDLTRITVYVLLPLSVVVALLLAGQGVVQSLAGDREVATLEPTTYARPLLDRDGAPLTTADGQARTEQVTTSTQALPMGPIASQEAIKELGTNGGGFLNANSAHPFENPTALTNFIEMVAILVIPFALVRSFGLLVGDPRQGRALLAAMLVLFVSLAWMAGVAEQRGNPRLAALGVDQEASIVQPGGNMEGKEARFGIVGSTLFAASTTATSCGAVNSMHDSMTPLGGFVPLFLIELGELAPGGVGTGLYTILVYAILGVFIAGLMIGRTPEYLGKRIESLEMKLASLFILTTPLVVLAGTAIAVLTDAGRAAVGNPGPHGFTEILYAFSSAANNNGSAFGGLAANSVFYNVATAIAMFVARFWPIAAVLALAGSLAAKKRVPVTDGTLPTHGPLFVALLIGTIVLIGVLTYVPALALGPIVEHFQWTGG